MAERKITGIELNRDDSVPGLLKELDAFLHGSDAHEKVMADFYRNHEGHANKQVSDSE